MSADMKICGLGDVLLPRCALEGLWTTTKTFSGNCPVEDWKRTPPPKKEIIVEVVRIEVLDYECYCLLRCGFVIMNHRTRRHFPKYDNLQIQSYPCLLVYNDWDELRRWRASSIYSRPSFLCTYNVTLRCVPINIFAVERQQVVHILSVCL